MPTILGRAAAAGQTAEKPLAWGHQRKFAAGAGPPSAAGDQGLRPWGDPAA
jgi:hypothetical protein